MKTFSSIPILMKSHISKFYILKIEFCYLYYIVILTRL